MFHPATLLLAWAGFVLILPLLSLPILGLLMFPALLGAFALAKQRTLRLLRRARWLLLSLAVLFAFATPGLAVPGLPAGLGMTQDGLALGAEQVARLVLLLSTLALVHEALGTAGLVTGLHCLLGLLCPSGALRERIVVRLMLVVEFVESASFQGGWREWLGEADMGPQSLALTVRRIGWGDGFALLLVAGGVAAALTW